MLRLLISPRAAADLESIADWIAEDNPTAAVDVVRGLLEAMELLARNPGIGHGRSDLADESLLTWPVAKNILIYQANETQLEIVAVVSGYMDLAALDF